jgi:hypothetical protein
MSDPEEPPPEVGYGKPPRQSRFQAGQSCNPKGRPKGVKNFATGIEAELNTRVPVKENGQHKMRHCQSNLARPSAGSSLIGCAARSSTSTVPRK